MKKSCLQVLTVLLVMTPWSLLWAQFVPSASSPVASSIAIRCDSNVMLKTRAERTQFLETSRSGDVVMFLDSLKRIAPTYTFGNTGTTNHGRPIPYVIAARPRIVTPEDAKKSGRPIVYINGNIHGGEVEGKEAMLAMLRDWTCSPRPNVLDSLILIVVPNYNADGNDSMAAQSVNRPEQRGPEVIGRRANAQNLDLNRDYIKVMALETRAALAMFNRWDPDVYIDLHTTNGSYHGYGLTYSPSLAPGAPLGGYTRELLQRVRERVRERHQLETFDYGNFEGQDLKALADSIKRGWYSYDARPRFGTNYYGLRGRIGILSEAFSHDPFERRIESTKLFVQETLSLIAEQAGEIRRQIRIIDSLAITRGPRDTGPEISIQAQLTTQPQTLPVLVEVLRQTGNSVVTEVGVPGGLQRTGRMFSQTMPVYDRFETVKSVKRPVGYLIPATDTAALTRLAAHGITTSPVRPRQTFAAAQSFLVDSVVRSTRPFQGHQQVRVTGKWSPDSTYRTREAMVFVATQQRLGALAVYLLEPESDDGLLVWNFFDASLKSGQRYPIVRVTRK